MTNHQERLGLYLRDRRLAEGLSLRQLGALLDLSHVFVGEVERGKKVLPRARWDALKAALPSIDLERMDSLAHEARESQLDLRGMGAPYQRAAELLMRRARRQDLNGEKLEQILQLLSMDGEG